MNRTIGDIVAKLPGFDCGLCGFKSCEGFAKIIMEQPEEIKRCIHLNKSVFNEEQDGAHPVCIEGQKTCTSCSGNTVTTAQQTWKDSLGRDFDFILDTFPNEPGPREVIIPHNPMRTRELDIKKGETLIGRPLGLSCGCPITHCGYVVDVDHVTGVMTWCVTGPLNPRTKEYKDLGYYSAQAYEGFANIAKEELKIGKRYWFLPHRCMLQWRHSGLVNFVNKTKAGLQIRIEGLFIG